MARGGPPGRRRRHHRGTGMTAVIPVGVETARDLVGPALQAAVARLSPDVRAVAAYHLGMTPAGSPPADSAAAGAPGPAARVPGAGKALRPALAPLSARAALP